MYIASQEKSKYRVTNKTLYEIYRAIVGKAIALLSDSTSDASRFGPISDNKEEKIACIPSC